jgi:hypothetical protein
LNIRISTRLGGTSIPGSSLTIATTSRLHLLQALITKPVTHGSCPSVPCRRSFGSLGRSHILHVQGEFSTSASSGAGQGAGLVGSVPCASFTTRLIFAKLGAVSGGGYILDLLSIVRPEVIALIFHLVSRDDFLRSSVLVHAECFILLLADRCLR